MPEIGTSGLMSGVGKRGGARRQYPRPTSTLPAGDIIQDFQLIARPNALHVLNAPSPAATASLAIGEEIARMVAG
jgi:L-2-hydroxyglutarate oxidase